MNANRLQKVIIEKGYTFSNISDLLGHTSVTTYRKLSDINKLTIGEAILLKNILELSDSEAAIIFLGA